MSLRINYSALLPADIFGEQTLRPRFGLGRGIRIFQDILLKRKYGLDYPDCLANHLAGVLKGPLALGEALARGSVVTPTKEYEILLQAGKLRLFVLRARGLSLDERDRVVDMWFQHIKGTKYDYPAVAFYALAALCFSGEVVLKLYDKICGRKLNMCSEGWSRAFRLAGHDMTGDDNAAPFHFLMASGMLPPPHAGYVPTMEDITDQVVVAG